MKNRTILTLLFATLFSFSVRLHSSESYNTKVGARKTRSKSTTFLYTPKIDDEAFFGPNDEFCKLSELIKIKKDIEEALEELEKGSDLYEKWTILLKETDSEIEDEEKE